LPFMSQIRRNQQTYGRPTAYEYLVISINPSNILSSI
jgi:hypothetical protein